jgi:hypothetical protein
MILIDEKDRFQRMLLQQRSQRAYCNSRLTKTKRRWARDNDKNEGTDRFKI